MQILKKSIQALKNSMHLLVFINLVFAATTFSLLYFTGRRIQDYVLMIYHYAPALQELESVLSEDVSLADLSKLDEALAVINQSRMMIFIVTLVSIVAFFLVWCFFQSLEWRMTHDSLKKKIRLGGLFDNYWRYALNFAIVTLPAFIIIFPSFYYLVGPLWTLFVNLVIRMHGLSEPLQPLPYALIAGLSFLVLFASYFTVIIYVLLNKHNKLLESIKKSFITGIKRIHVLLPIHLICLLIIIPIIYLDSYLVKFLDFKISAIISLLVYFTLVSYYQVLMVSLLEKA